MPDSPETENAEKKQKSFLEAFQEAADRKPSYPVLVFDGRYFSYRSIDQMSSSLAEFLSSKGCGSDSRVGILLPMSPQYLISVLGILKSGAVPVNMGSLRNSEYAALSDVQKNDWIIIKSDSDIIPARGEKVITARIGDLMNFTRAMQTDGHQNNRPPGFVSRLIDIILDKPRGKETGGSGEEKIGFLSYDTSGSPFFPEFTGNELCARASLALERISSKGSVFRNASCIPPASPEGFILSVAMPVLSSGYSIFPSNPDPGLKIFRLADTYNANFITVFQEIISRAERIEYHNSDRIRGLIFAGLGSNYGIFSDFATRNNFRMFYFFGPPELMGITHLMEGSGESSGKLIPLVPGETELVDESGNNMEINSGVGSMVIGDAHDAGMNRELGIRAKLNSEGSLEEIEIVRDIAVILGRHTSRHFIEKSTGRIPGVSEFVADFREVPPGIRRAVFYCVKEERRTDERKVISYLQGKLSSHNLPSEIVWKSDIPKSISGHVLRNLLVEKNS